MYDDGGDALKNGKTAMEWYALAAEQGVAEAQYNMGRNYYYGHGVLKDFKRAYIQSNLAAYNGNTSGSENREVIATKMTPADISKAQDMSSACLASNYMDC